MCVTQKAYQRIAKPFGVKLLLHYRFLRFLVNDFLTHLLWIEIYNLTACFNRNNVQSLYCLLKFIFFKNKICCSSHTNGPMTVNILYTNLLICMSLLCSTFGSVWWNPCLYRKTKNNVKNMTAPVYTFTVKVKLFLFCFCVVHSALAPVSSS